MTTLDTQAVPQPFLASKLKRKNFSYQGDAHIHGDVQIAAQLVIGGDLLIDGNLQAEEVYCLGKLTVTGDIKVDSLYIGHALDGGGNIEVSYLLKTGCTAEWMARMLEFSDNKKTGASMIDQLVHPAIAAQRQGQHPAGEFGTVQALGVLQADVLDVQSDVLIDDTLDVGEVQYIGGNLSAYAIFVKGDCNCRGEIFSESDIQVAGELFADTVIAQGNVQAKSLQVEQDIDTWGTIRAQGDILSKAGEIRSGRWIATKGSIQASKYIKAAESVVGEKGITAGKDYGILAGLQRARSEWAEQAFVSAPTKPAQLLSGKYVAENKCKTIDALEKKRRWKLDWEVIRSESN